jgi:hypothetical protein
MNDLPERSPTEILVAKGITLTGQFDEAHFPSTWREPTI